MLVQGHPYGLCVTVMDGDTVSPFNCVRQPFSRSEIGLNKGIVLMTRINLFLGLTWEAIPCALTAQTLAASYDRFGEPSLRPDVVIGCVDTRAARAYRIGRPGIVTACLIVTIIVTMAKRKARFGEHPIGLNCFVINLVRRGGLEPPRDCSR
jgi:hypothetical protein